MTHSKNNPLALHRKMQRTALWFMALVFFASQPAAIVSAVSSSEFKSDNVILFYDESGTGCVGTAPTADSGGAAGGVPLNFSLGSDPKERRVNLIKALMADYGLTAEQAAGPVGNFMRESGGAHLPPDVNEGGHAGPPRFSGGYGWAQWTASRQDTFIAFAVKKGYMKSSGDRATDAANYAYLKNELAGGYRSTITQLKKQKTPEDAAVSFEATFERAGVPALEERKTGARQAFTEYQQGGGGSGTGTGGASECSVGGSAIVGDVAFPLKTTKSKIQNRTMFANGTADQGGHPYIAYDILVAPGTEVVAFMGGKVTNISSDRCPGRLVGIYNQEANMIVSYMHLDFNDHIGMGTEVQPGERVGKVGPAQNGCGIAHLHIDAMKGRTRLSCSRLGCPSSTQRLFADLGPKLFETYQLLPQ